VTARPVPLDRQVADEHARHPTPRAATLAGVRFGLMTGGVTIAIDIGNRMLPSDWTPRPVQSWQSEFVGWMLGLGVGVLVSVAVFQLAAAILRWRRRAAARFWYSERAA
jgi:hypothetical protein